MLHPSTKKLIDRLAEMTERGKLDWVDGPDDTVTYVTEGYSVSLLVGLNELVITSKDGKELERASANELGATPTEDGSTYSHVVAAMTKEATRIARGTESAISTLLAGIDFDGDGVPDDIAEAAPAEELEPEAQIEDVADDTAALSADDVAGIETEDAPVETTPPVAADEPEIEDAPVEMASASEVDEPEMEAAPIAEFDEPEVETAPIKTEASAPAEQATAAEPAPVEQGPEPEDEVDVTEAVQRMAEEVSERENGTTSAAAALATTAASIAMAGKAREETPVEETPEIDPPVLEATEDHPYVPFDHEASAPAPVETPAASTEAPTFEPSETLADTPPAPAGTREAPVESAVEAFSTPVDETTTTITEPQSFSLSGIGAGFGLGALTATTEATGTPTPKTPVATEDQRIIIDATDDVPIMQPEPETELQPVETETPTKNTSSAEEEDADALKPRTRFNPWN